MTETPITLDRSKPYGRACVGPDHFIGQDGYLFDENTGEFVRDSLSPDARLVREKARKEAARREAMIWKESDGKERRCQWGSWSQCTNKVRTDGDRFCEKHSGL